MSARPRTHTEGASCHGCNVKLLGADPVIAAWFRRQKAMNEALHVSCAHREQEEQDAFFRAGKSDLRWPLSKHNAMQNGKPASLALDLFELIDGVARWNPQTFARINASNEACGLRIRWGGTFKLRKGGNDACHFELA